MWFGFVSCINNTFANYLSFVRAPAVQSGRKRL